VSTAAARTIGVSTAEATRRRATEGPNELPTARPRNLLQQAWAVVRQPMILLLLVAGSINFALAEPLDGAILMFAVIVVIAISIYQERKTENALAALRELSSPRALVIRDGRRERIAGRDVVRGDAIVLVEGDRVPADAVVVEGAGLSVDESALTGESVPVRKAAGDESAPMGAPGGDATPWVFSGTLVVKGRGLAIVRSIGAGTELGRIGTALRTIEEEPTPLQREVGRLVRVVAVVALLAAAVVAVIYALTRGAWLEGVLAGIATAMAMLPEEFPIVLTVFLALGAWRMSKRNVLTRRSPVIETLGSATVICVDKTGTITMNSMTVRCLVVDGETWLADDGAALPERFREITEVAMLASPPDPFDPMDRAFTALAQSRLVGTGRLHPDWELVREYPLTERLLAVSNAWRVPGDPQLVVAAKGAPEAIAELCGLDAPRLAALRDQVDAATAGGQRVLAVARARHTGALPPSQTDLGFEFVGLAGLHDPVRPGVADAVAELARAGVRTVMITGDYPGTAIAIAREIGLDHAAGAITGAELRELSVEELATRVRTVSVFARMVPEQKLQLIRALKANGEVVGMTGDGVNDAPALRAADIGIAMGSRGTDVARESAALVITDDDFSSIAGGIRQGRGIFDNLRKAMSYIIAVHVPIFGMALIPVLAGSWPLVLVPVLIAFLELIIDPACSVVFEAEEADPKVMTQPPRGLGAPMFDARVLTIALLQGLSALAAVLGVYLWGLATERPDDVVRSITFATLVIGNLALILVNRSWRLPVWLTFRERRNPALKWILMATSALLLLLLLLPPMRDAFNLGPITLVDWAVAIGAGLAGVAWFEVYKRARESG
jgi:Ca2+-transporting ATPase